MKRCPKCNCGAEFTNKAAYYAAKIGGGVLGLGAGAVAGAIHPGAGHAGHIAQEVARNVAKNVKKHFKCTNHICNYEWDE